MAKKSRNPKSLTLAELKEVLQLAGSHEATDESVAAVFAGGNAIRNPDGTYNFFHVVAWLARHAK